MIQLTRRGIVSGKQEDLDSLRQQFDRNDYLILPKLFETNLLEEIIQRVQAAPFQPRDHHGIAVELCMDSPVTAALLNFLPSSPSFLKIIERITGQSNLGQFSGRVYQMNSSDGHYDSWHNDCFGGRAATMTVKLSPHVFEGGRLQLKRRDSDKILHEIHNTGLGDALIFRISPELVHRVQGVTGPNPKFAFAGWFLTGEEFLPNLGKRLSPGP